MQPPPGPPFDDELVERLLHAHESLTLEFKRVGGDGGRKLQTVVAFANTDGGLLVLGIEDEDAARGKARVTGIQSNPEAIDELRRHAVSRVTPPLTAPGFAPPRFTEIGCTLRDGSLGSVVLVHVEKSVAVHSVVDGGTHVRAGRTNRQLSAAEIIELSMQRGVQSWVNGPADVSLAMLEVPAWREYAEARRLTRPMAKAMEHLGLARRGSDGGLRPTRAAVLLFAEDPAGLLDSKCSIRLFQYRGDRIEHAPDTNLLRPPRSIGGSLLTQIRAATEATIDALATGLQMGPLGFEVAQDYPVRVLREAITNAVLHRDYRLQADIHIRVFANRVEVESPGLLPANVTTANIRTGGSHPRNRAVVDHLREFPLPPNLDAGEGVRMMFDTMERSNRYPPLYLTRPDIPRESVLCVCFNEARPDTWTQVEHYLSTHADIGNIEVRTLLRSEDSVRASRLLKRWVDLGLLVSAAPGASKRKRRYRRPGNPSPPGLFSQAPDNEAGR